MQMMRAVEITQAGGPEVLKLTSRPIPTPRAGEVVIKVSHAGVNRPDALQRAGLYRAPADASDLPGLEASGVVYSLGQGTAGYNIGDPVCALLPGGGYAEYAALPAAHLMPVPKRLSMAQAAAVCETAFTVYSNVFMRGALKPNETLLVHGGASGIGTMAIQMATALGARVVVTARGAEKCAKCLALGAFAAIDYETVDFVDEVRALGGADVILDMVGGDYLPRNIKCLKEDGRLVQIAFLRGAKAEVNFAQVMLRRLTITGSTLRPQSDDAKSAIAQALRLRVWPLIEQGHIIPVMDSLYPLEQACDAHERMESNAHIGKIVLTVDPALG